MGILSPLLSRDFLTGILWQWSVALVLTIFKMSLRFIGNGIKCSNLLQPGFRLTNAERVCWE
jgi:hypothetical protein